MAKPGDRVAFQGEPGAYSQQAAMERWGPGVPTVPCASLEKLFQAVGEGQAELGLVPIENSYAGTIAQTVDLLDHASLFIVGELFYNVRHALLAPRGSSLPRIKRVYSHPQALEQCREFLNAHGLEPWPALDTAGAAREVSERGLAEEAAIAHASCGRSYGLRVLRRSIQTARQNITRFLLLAREPVHTTGPVKTTLVFETKHVPSALYKALGGFATNGVNLTRIESRPSRKRPMHYTFHLDFEGGPDDKPVRNALRELRFFSKRVRILGTYPRAVHLSSGGR